MVGKLKVVLYDGCEYSPKRLDKNVQRIRDGFNGYCELDLKTTRDVKGSTVSGTLKDLLNEDPDVCIINGASFTSEEALICAHLAGMKSDRVFYMHPCTIPENPFDGYSRPFRASGGNGHLNPNETKELVDALYAVAKSP